MNRANVPVNPDIESELETMKRVGRAWRELRRGSANSAMRDLMFAGDDFSIEPSQYDALEQIILYETIRMGDLADALRIDPSTATRAVQNLARDGLVERIDHGGDGRVVVVGPTGKGRAVHWKVAANRRLIVSRVMEQFPPEERETVAACLERFADAVACTVADLTRDPS